NPGSVPQYQSQPLPGDVKLPRSQAIQNEMRQTAPPPSIFSPGPLSDLPRRDTRLNERIPYKWENPEYPLTEQGIGLPHNAEPLTNRWRITLPFWRRYVTGNAETPYLYPEPALWH